MVHTPKDPLHIVKFSTKRWGGGDSRFLFSDLILSSTIDDKLTVV